MAQLVNVTKLPNYKILSIGFDRLGQIGWLYWWCVLSGSSCLST